MTYYPWQFLVSLQGFIIHSFSRSMKWMTTDSAANSLLNNNCFSISATAFITNIHSSYDRRQTSRHSWNCSRTKQRREFQNKLHLETSFLTNISILVAVYFCFYHHAFSLLRHCNQTPYSSYCRGRNKIISINSIKSIFCVGIRVFQISMTTPS